MKNIIFKVMFFIIVGLLSISFTNVTFCAIADDIYSLNKENSVIYDVLAETTIEMFKANMGLNANVNIYNNEIAQKNDTLVGSGMTLNDVDGKKYSIAVKGDANGDGKTTSTDILIFKQILIEIQTQRAYDIYALDINEDKNLSPTDLLNLRIYMVNDKDVEISPKGIVMDTKKITINYDSANNTATAKARVVPITANKEITWTSENNSIAEVDNKGTITAKQIGNVIITAKNSAQQTATCEVEVTLAATPTPKPTPTATPKPEATQRPTVTPPIIQENISKRLFVGDSRTVNMKNSVAKSDMDMWSCEIGVGAPWLENHGVENIDNKITQGTAIIIMLGINDLYRQERYYTYINNSIDNWESKGAKTFFVSVNPLHKDPLDSYTSNSRIEQFNSVMKEKLDKRIIFIDTYYGMDWPANYYSSDGAHFSSAGANALYNYLVNCIK